MTLTYNPDFGCFPSQDRLAEDAEMSISALNDHLAKLQELRLIHRVRVHDPRTHKRQATRYILGFEDGFPQEPTPETGDGFSGTDEEQDDDPTPDSGHGAISGFPAKPSPDFAQSHLRNPETNCSIPDDHISPRRSALFMARSVLRECGGSENSPGDCFPAKRSGVRAC